MVSRSSILLLVALLITGCGGSGGGTSRQQLSREQVQELLRNGFTGIDRLPIGPSDRSPKTTAPHPSGPSGLNKRAAGASHRGPQDIYFDSELELWALDFMEGDPQGEHSWGTHYFIDEEATQPAGDDIWLSQWNQWPNVDHEELHISAGPLAGLVTIDHMTLFEDGHGTETANGFVPGEGSWEYTMSWPDGGISTVDAKYTDLEGRWTRYRATPQDDGSMRYLINTSAGVEFDLHFDPEYSGHGTITGPSEFLPATLQWDTNGDGAINWADGSTTTFTNWDF